MITLNIFLILLASTSDAIMDTISSHFPTSVFSNSSNWKIVKTWSNARKLKLYKWLNPYYSWRNKWLLINNQLVFNNKKYWYYLWIYKPKYKEKFPYSSTILVRFTDLWHTCNSIQLTCLITFGLLNPIIFVFNNFYLSLLINYLVYMLIYTINFEIWHKYILIKNEKSN